MLNGLWDSFNYRIKCASHFWVKKWLKIDGAKYDPLSEWQNVLYHARIELLDKLPSWTKHRQWCNYKHVQNDLQQSLHFPVWHSVRDVTWSRLRTKTVLQLQNWRPSARTIGLAIWANHSRLKSKPMQAEAGGNWWIVCLGHTSKP